MKITLNNKPLSLPESDISIKDLVEIQKIPANGTAIALNDRLIVRSRWENTLLNDGDKVIVISAAFGG